MSFDDIPGHGPATSRPQPAAATGRALALARPAAVLVAAASAASVVGTLDPNTPGHYPSCPFLALTGQYCPGCGGLRCVHALAHGDLAGATQHNALAVATLPWLAWLWLRWVIREVRTASAAASVPGPVGQPPEPVPGGPRGVHPRRPGTPARLADPRLLRLLTAVVLAFWLVRNLPGCGFLAP